MKFAAFAFIAIPGGQLAVRAFTISSLCDVCKLKKTHLFAGDDQYLNDLRQEREKEKLSLGGDPLNDLRQEREKELLDQGGDPFFLTDDDLLEGITSNDVEDDSSMPSMSLLAGGGITNMMGAAQAEEEAQDTPSEPEFEWDGESDDSAYFD